MLGCPGLALTYVLGDSHRPWIMVGVFTLTCRGHVNQRLPLQWDFNGVFWFGAFLRHFLHLCCIHHVEVRSPHWMHFCFSVQVLKSWEQWIWLLP